MSATATDSGARRLRPTTLLLGALALVVASYAQAPQGGFVWDDHPLIEEQPAVKVLQPLHTYFARMFWSDPLDFQNAAFYRPLTTLSFAVDHWIGGGAPFVFHVTNVLLHLLACALVYLLAVRVGAKPAAAALATALFGAFPRLTECVCWISGRTDILATIGALGGLAISWSRLRERQLLAGLAIAGGLLAKEVAAAALVGIAVHELLAHTGPRRLMRAAAAAWPAAIGPAIYAAARLHAQLSLHAESPAPFYALPASIRPLVALQTLGTYALMLLDPLRPRLQIGILGMLSPWHIALGAIVLVGLLWSGRRVLAERRDPRIIALFATAIAALLPVLHLLPLAVNVVAADRFLYLPCAALAVALSLELPTLLPRHARALAAAGCALALAFAVATYLRSLDWIDEARLWRVAAENSPALDSKPWGNLGNLYFARNRMPEALEAYHHAEELDLRAAQVIYGFPQGRASQYTGNIALAEQRLGHHSQAIALLEGLVERFPMKLLYRYNLAMAYARALEFDRAATMLKTAPALGSDDQTRAELLALVARSQQRLRALPPESPDESPGVRAERASVDDELGRSFEAAERWRAVVDDPRSTRELVEKGAGYLAIYGSREDAERALAQLRTLGVAPGRLDALEQLVRDRFAS